MALRSRAALRWIESSINSSICRRNGWRVGIPAELVALSHPWFGLQPKGPTMRPHWLWRGWLWERLNRLQTREFESYDRYRVRHSLSSRVAINWGPSGFVDQLASSPDVAGLDSQTWFASGVFALFRMGCPCMPMYAHVRSCMPYDNCYYSDDNDENTPAPVA